MSADSLLNYLMNQTRFYQNQISSDGEKRRLNQESGNQQKQVGPSLADVMLRGSSLSKEDSDALVRNYLGVPELSANDSRNPNVAAQYREQSDAAARQQLGQSPIPNGKNNLQILQDAADRAKRTGDYGALALDVMAVNPQLAQNLLELVSTGKYRQEQQKTDLEKYRMMYGDDGSKNLSIDSDRGLLIDKKTAQARPISLNGQPIGAKKSSTQDKRATDANEVLSLAKMAEPLIDESTGSVIGAGVDAVAGAFGHGTEGAMASAKLKAIEGMLVSKMPRMEGPQSDHDVKLYKQMAGQIGDPTIPANVKRDALETVRQINSRYAGVEYQQPQGNSFDSLPDPRQYNGKTIRDEESGARLRSNGTTWVRVQ